MSKILYWSPLHGQGQTSSLHATAFVMSLVYKKKVLMMQTHFTLNNLESPFVGQNVAKQKPDENEMFQDIGLDMAVTYSNMRKLSLNVLESCCLTFPNTSIMLLPGTETKNRETFDRDIGKSVGRLVRDADECVDMVLIDANSGYDELSFALMDVTDLIVVNLTQRKYVLDNFFNQYGDKFINNKKAFYLFGDYDDNSSYNINNIRRKYRKFINSNNSGVIPYCTNFNDAQNESNIINFMRSGLRKDEEGSFSRFVKKLHRSGKASPEETEYFFHRTRLSVEKMFSILNITPRKENGEGQSR